MKKTSWVKVTVAMFVLLATVTAIAADGTSNIRVPSAVELNGQKIAAGEYKISWTGKDNDVQVTFRTGKGVVMTVPAKLVENPTAASYTSVGYAKDGSVSEIRLQGKKTVLVFTR